MNQDRNSKTAVALNYDGTGAPTITATGRGLVGEEIIELAHKSNVPIVEDAKLAGLLATVPLGEEIPEELFRAVAEILVFILKLETSLDETI